MSMPRSYAGGDIKKSTVWPRSLSTVSAVGRNLKLVQDEVSAPMALPGLQAACAGSSTRPSPSPVDQSSGSAPASVRILANTPTDHLLDVTAKVLTSAGVFVPNAMVMFTIDSGTIAPTAVTTAATGEAHTVATASGQAHVTASVDNVSSTIVVQGSAPRRLWRIGRRRSARRVDGPDQQGDTFTASTNRR